MSGAPEDDKVIVKRPLEPGMKLEFEARGQAGSRRQTYSDFLKLDQLLSLQAPIQDPPQRDELLFVILHQVAELWLKLLHAELVEGCRSIRADDIKTCNKTLARSKAILEQLISAWKVLLTMTTEISRSRGPDPGRRGALAKRVMHQHIKRLPTQPRHVHRVHDDAPTFVEQSRNAQTHRVKSFAAPSQCRPKRGQERLMIRPIIRAAARGPARRAIANRRDRR